MDGEYIDKGLIKIEDLYNKLIQKSKTDLVRILDKNSLTEKLVRFACKFAKSITETSSKV